MDAMHDPPPVQMSSEASPVKVAAAESPLNFHVLIGCTASVAALKLPAVVEALKITATSLNVNVKVQAVVTEHSKHFFDISKVPCKVYTDEEEWTTWQGRGDPVLHIELRRWADLMLIAPLDANTMAKLANGLCDNLLTCVVRAWDCTRPLFFAPAMNTYMWEHPLTAEHLTKLEAFGYKKISPISKTLVCGDTGTGAMAEVETLVDTVMKYITSGTGIKSYGPTVR